jgi:hypothetical protein
LRDLGRLGLRLLGIWTAVESIGWLVGAFQLYAGKVDRPPAWEVFGYLLPAVAYALVASLLVARTDRLALWLFPEKQVTSLGLPSEQVQAVAFSIMGVWLVVQSLPTMVYAFVLPRLTPTLSAIDSGRIGYPALIFSSLRFGIGLCLILGAKGLTKLWHGLWSAPESGIQPPG